MASRAAAYSNILMLLIVGQRWVVAIISISIISSSNLIFINPQRSPYHLLCHFGHCLTFPVPAPDLLWQLQLPAKHHMPGQGNQRLHFECYSSSIALSGLRKLHRPRQISTLVTPLHSFSVYAKANILSQLNKSLPLWSLHSKIREKADHKSNKQFVHASTKLSARHYECIE